jgi:hypothetical protein
VIIIKDGRKWTESQKILIQGDPKIRQVCTKFKT